MRMSHMFGKTRRDVSKEETSFNAQFLTKAGFIEKVMAGVYAYLPLGVRVLHKIEQVVREEMDRIANEVLLSALSPKELWKTTARLEAVDVLFQASGGNKRSQTLNPTEYILNPTHEELVTPLAKQFHLSYKDLPVAVYQIQTKFRNEPRAKSGLLRGREFRMKDLYSFHRSEADLKDYYEKAKEAYWAVFRRLDLAQETVIALASGGDFTPDYSHEFQTRCDTGEDQIFWAEKAQIAYNREVAPSAVSKTSDLYKDGELEPMTAFEGAGIIGVVALAKQLGIPKEKTTKTMLYETDDGKVVAAAVRGDYAVNELKLKKVVGCKHLKLASEATVRRVTGAEIGYAGLVNLPSDVLVIVDDALQGRQNFECGANKTNYHLVNVNFGRDLPIPERFYDIKLAKAGDLYPKTGESYEVFAASEVGNIFPLNTKFSEAFGYTYTDEAGKQQPVFMGCYGIGTSRIMGLLVEKFHDDKGIIWPKAIAPFQVHVLALSKGDVSVLNQVIQLYDKLGQAGFEVLLDDRDVSPGEKFADADLIGIPLRLVVSDRTLKEKSVEWKERTATETRHVSLTEIVSEIQSFLTS